MRTLFTDVEVDGRGCDVLVGPGGIEAVGDRLASTGADEHVDGGGGALIPGLHDHHLHLLATAAARTSVDCSTGLDRLRSAPPGPWVRGVGAVESVDRHVLDALVPDRPARVQHSSGGLWMLNSRALAAVSPALAGPDVERDRDGVPTGRLWRFDSRLRAALPDRAAETRQSLATLVEELHRLGITSVTDATPDLDPPTVALLSDLPLGVTLLGDPDGTAPRKILVRDHDLPDLAALTTQVAEAHEQRRPVAVHCVTREALLLTLAALDDAGRLPGDRIEHAAVVPPEVRARLRGLTVVTQPGMLVARTERYRTEVDPDDLDHLYPFASLHDAGVPVLSSSDAPYGPLDPWEGLRAARDRDLAPHERVPVAVAFPTLLRDSAGLPRRIAAGEAPAVCLLEVPLAEALRAPAADLVRLVRDPAPHRRIRSGR
ncbi:amidohydrolase [Nocardioides marmoriginsengisoli]|uniref:Amidohydrolase n=1 Tax=Nocardioides marmoriginsengisoli TaxID=661483 RepID=A0A3N0CCQ8_9ACTN|nr:amidohydrolase family protein [Nocardioides marmoriginsengisoli]RNL61089.1 amidohydrolase [Nocardioides marmoriginsengisoli]